VEIAFIPSVPVHGLSRENFEVRWRSWPESRGPIAAESLFPSGWRSRSRRPSSSRPAEARGPASASISPPSTISAKGSTVGSIQLTLRFPVPPPPERHVRLRKRRRCSEGPTSRIVAAVHDDVTDLVGSDGATIAPE